MVRRLYFAWLLVWSALSTGLAHGAPPDEKKSQGQGVAASAFSHDVAPFLKAYCTSCHGGMRPRGKLSLETYREDPKMSEDRAVWAKVARALRGHDMPPENKPQPKAEEVAKVTAWIDTELARVEKT